MTVQEVANKCRVTCVVVEIEMHHAHLAYSRSGGEVDITHEQMMAWVARRGDRIKAHHACRKSNRQEIAWQNRVKRAKEASLIPVELEDSPNSVVADDPFC